MLCCTRLRFAPDRLACEMLPGAEMLALAHSQKVGVYAAMSFDSNSDVNRGIEPE